MQRHLTFTLILVCALLAQAVLAATSVTLPLAETNQPRTRCASLAGTDSHLYFTRYWANVLPGTNCAFYRIPRAMTGSGDWTALAPAPKFVQEPPSWFETNIMQNWAGAGMSVGEVGGQQFVFMFGSIAKGGVGEDIGRDLLGYNIGGDAWEIVTNRYDGGGTDAACTFVTNNSIYGFWTGWTPMQRWSWDKNSLGIVQQATVGSAALHPVAGVRVGNLGVFIVFQSGLASAKLIAQTAGTLDSLLISSSLPFNVGMGCAIERIPAPLSASGRDELWILRGGSGDNSGDGQPNNTPSSDVLVLAFTNTPTSIAIVSQRRISLPYPTGAVGSSMARVSNLVYFLRYGGATNPEMFSIPTDFISQNPPETPWPLNGNNKQRQGWYTNGWALTGGRILWTNQTQTGVGIYGSGVTDGQRFYLPVDPAPGNNNKELLAIDVNGGTNVWAIDLVDWANGTPALSQDRVYIGDNAGFAYAVNKLTGAIIWSNNLGAGSCNGGVLLSDDRVYIEADGDAGGTFCLNADSGAVLWHNNAPTNAGTWTGNGPSLSPNGAAVYVHTEGDAGGRIFAMDALTGSTLWYRVYASGWGGQEPIVDNAGNIYCASDGVTTPAGNDVLISLQPNGTTNWIYDLGMNAAWSHGGYALSPDGATIYCSRRSGGGGTGIGLTAITTATGTKKWDSACGDTGGGCVFGAGNIILGVFETATGRAVKAIKDNGASGDVLWSTQIASSGNMWTWPTLLPNGDVIAMTEFVIAHITLPAPSSQLAAYEAMNYPVGSLGGQTGGYGWGSAWDGSKPVVADGLTYEQGGQRLATAGNKISVASGAESNRRLLTNGFEYLLSPSGGFCGDGKTLWLSLLLKDASTTVDAYGGLWLNNVAGTSQTGWDITRNWGAYRWFIEASETGTSILHTAFYTTNQPQATLFVAKMEFLPGNELCSFWFNPPLSNAPPAPDYVLSVSNFSFSGVHLSGSDLIYDDEIRAGETWQSVVPIAAPPIGWCNLQWPYTLTVVNTNGPGVSDKVYGQVWIDGVTSEPGPTPGLKAWIGYGPSNALPNAPSWTWTMADFNVQVGNNDEFHTNFVIAQAVSAGDYAYCYYYEYQTNAAPSTGYGQKDGGPRMLATYNPAQSGILTVVPEPALLLGLVTGLVLWLRKR